MKKMVMALSFLFMVMIIPTAHAVEYTLYANQIWVDTGICLDNSSVTFSNAATHSDWEGHLNEWTWGIGYYFENKEIPRAWTDADGGSGVYYKGSPYARKWGGGDPGLDNDEWYVPGNHGELIGYIGDQNPLYYVNAKDKEGAFFSSIFGIGTATVSMTGTGHVWIGMNDDFVNLDEGPEDNFGWVNVNIVTNPVPEPAALLLLGLGLTGLAVARKKLED